LKYGETKEDKGGKTMIIKYKSNNLEVEFEGSTEEGIKLLNQLEGPKYIMTFDEGKSGGDFTINPMKDYTAMVGLEEIELKAGKKQGYQPKDDEKKSKDNPPNVGTSAQSKSIKDYIRDIMHQEIRLARWSI